MEKIAFDLDGTILDSKFRHQKVLFDILNKKGLSEEIEELNDYVEYKSIGRNTKQYLEYKYGESIDSEEICKSWIENIEKMEYLDFDKVYENAEDILFRLSLKYDLYLVTARSNKKNTLKQLEKLDLTKYFKDIYIVSNRENSALNKYDITKDLQLKIIIGDTEVDYKWAKYSDVEFIPTDAGFRNNLWWKALNIETYSNLYEVEKRIYNIINEKNN